MGSNHIGRIAREVRKSKLQMVPESSWNIANSEEVADELDLRDGELIVDTVHSWQLKKLARSRLVAASIENGIKFVFLHGPLYLFTYGRVRFC